MLGESFLEVGWCEAPFEVQEAVDGFNVTRHWRLAVSRRGLTVKQLLQIRRASLVGLAQGFQQERVVQADVGVSGAVSRTVAITVPWGNEERCCTLVCILCFGKLIFGNKPVRIADPESLMLRLNRLVMAFPALWRTQGTRHLS